MILLAISTVSFASPLKCETVAQKAILKKFRSSFYAYGKRVRHFEGSSCRSQRGNDRYLHDFRSRMRKG